MESFWFIIFISFIITLISTLVYKYTTNQKLMKSLKEEIVILQKKGKKDKEIWNKQMTIMKNSLASTFYTFIPIIILFRWLSTHMSTEKIINIWFIHIGWLGTYVIFTIVFSYVVRKILKVY